MLKFLNFKKISLSLKKKKKNKFSLSNTVLAKIDFTLKKISRVAPHEETVMFEEGEVTFKVTVVSSPVNSVSEKKLS